MSKTFPPLELKKEQVQMILDEQQKALEGTDTVFFVDGSGSMQNPYVPGQSRWSAAMEAIEIVAPIAAKIDEDGIKLVLVQNKKDSWESPEAYEKRKVRDEVTSASAVTEFFDGFKPKGGTPLVEAVEKELTEHVEKCKANKKTKRLNLIILTDGEPNTYNITLSELINNTAVELYNAGYEDPKEKLGIQIVLITDELDVQTTYRVLDDRQSYMKDGKRVECDLVDVTFNFELQIMGGVTSPISIAKILAGNWSELLDEIVDTEAALEEIKKIDEHIKKENEK